MTEITKFNLSEYSHSILNDERNVIVLAWIEKSGISNEDEITDEVGIEDKELKNILVKLFKNQLIQLSQNFLKISAKGKQVIDTLNLSKKIITNIYSHLRINSVEKLFLNQILNYYRDNYFNSYLITLNSLKIWNRISDSNNFEMLSNGILDEYYLTIIIHDVYHILKEQSYSIINKTSSSDFTAFDYDSESKITESPKLKKAFELIKEFYALKSINDFKSYNYHQRELYEFIYLKDLFFTDEKAQNKLIIELKKSNKQNINERVGNYFYYWKAENLNQIENYFNITKKYSQIPNKSLEKETSTDLNSFIFYLENSETIHELSEKLDMEELEIINILSRISKKIEFFNFEFSGKIKPIKK